MKESAEQWHYQELHVLQITQRKLVREADSNVTGSAGMSWSSGCVDNASTSPFILNVCGREAKEEKEAFLTERNIQGPDKFGKNYIETPKSIQQNVWAQF